MDAISQCEHEVRRKGDEGQPTLWKLLFQKELFTPWHDSMWDPVSTDIIYRQVIRGLKSKKYSSEKVSVTLLWGGMVYPTIAEHHVFAPCSDRI